MDESIDCPWFRVPDAVLHPFAGDSVPDPGPEDPELIEPGTTPIPPFTDLPVHHTFLTDEETSSGLCASFTIKISSTNAPACEHCRERRHG
ncbi:hypothetical protein [Streptomyces sp. Caat 7-52]|uniref:hypothetical protein n=1 Tax=Streptomyces sp. Caat 7-52 TaxID=2949637 RepID=UPI0020361CA3|nr:hypothetical protein [Streptomyces sp. Caat 7-52]